MGLKSASLTTANFPSDSRGYSSDQFESEKEDSDDGKSNIPGDLQLKPAESPSKPDFSPMKTKLNPFESTPINTVIRSFQN